MEAALQDRECTEVGAHAESTPLARDTFGAMFVVPAPGGLMIRVDGNPVYRIGAAIADLRIKFAASKDPTIATVDAALVWAYGALEFIVEQSILPTTTKGAGRILMNRIHALFNEADKSRAIPLQERSQFFYEILQFETTLANDLNQLDVYWVEPKLGYSTTVLLGEADRIFPEAIRAALPQRVKDDIIEAGRCLAFDLSTSVGFHVLRAVELVVLDYFSIPGWDQKKAKTWIDYSRRLSHYKVHRKIRNMIDRLAELHRNELMHAEAILSKEEAAVLFALAQEVIPLMVADIAKRKGAPIGGFPILSDPRWQ